MSSESHGCITPGFDVIPLWPKSSHLQCICLVVIMNVTLLMKGRDKLYAIVYNSLSLHGEENQIFASMYPVLTPYISRKLT